MFSQGPLLRGSQGGTPNSQKVNSTEEGHPSFGLAFHVPQFTGQSLE